MQTHHLLVYQIHLGGHVIKINVLIVSFVMCAVCITRSTLSVIILNFLSLKQSYIIAT